MKKVYLFFITLFFYASSYSQNSFYLSYGEQEYSASIRSAIETQNFYFVVNNSYKYINDSTYHQIGTIIKLSKQGEILKEKKNCFT